jgi:hypothetical protein
MKLNYLIFTTAILFNLTTKSQNLVPNSSFEIGSPSYPFAISQLQSAYPWKNFSSSDWLSSTLGHFRGGYDPTGLTTATNPNTITHYITAHTGDKYIGFGPCEGAQVKLSSKTKVNDIVQVSFWWSPRTTEDTKINIYLLKDKAQDDALDDCFNPNIEYEFSANVSVNSSGSNATHIPGEWYYYQSELILVEDDEYEWLAIKGENVGGQFSSRKYTYIDDVHVSSVSVCSHICTPKDDVSFMQITGSPNQLATAMQGNSGSNWFMLVENASDIEFEVFDRWGGSIYYYNAYDPSGLKDPGYPNYAFEWNGNFNDGSIIPLGQYNFNLTIKNCRRQLKYVAEPLLILPAQTPPVLEPPFQTNILKNCCKPNATFNNITFQDGFREDVNDFIHAGTGGPTIVPSNTSVKFYAGKSITLGPGFHAEAGSNFSTEIVPCGSATQKRLASRNISFPTQEEMDSLFQKGKQKMGNTLYVNPQFNIYPNPTTGVFNVDISTFEKSALIEVYNIVGKQVFSKTISNNELVINITNQSKGIYFVKATVGADIFNKKIIYQ